MRFAYVACSGVGRHGVLCEPFRNGEVPTIVPADCRLEWQRARTLAGTLGDNS